MRLMPFWARHFDKPIQRFRSVEREPYEFFAAVIRPQVDSLARSADRTVSGGSV
jgi:hypothetical protein